MMLDVESVILGILLGVLLTVVIGWAMIYIMVSWENKAYEVSLKEKLVEEVKLGIEELNLRIKNLEEKTKMKVKT